MSGPPGVGKTRLALRVASLMLDFFADGVYFVGLSPISEVGLVLPAVAQSLGVKEARHRPLLDHLKRQLWDKDILLVLEISSRYRRQRGACMSCWWKARG
jgi:predicted ATPase